MSRLLVRRAEPAHYAAIAALTVAAYTADGQLGGGHGYERVLADVPARAVAGELLVALDEATGAVLGSVTFVLPGSRYAELSRPGEAEFRMLAVDPARRGRGVGAALVRACLARAVEVGGSAVVISVRSFSVPAQKLYANLGFVRVPELDWSPAPGVELLALRLELSPDAPVGAAADRLRTAVDHPDIRSVPAPGEDHQSSASIRSSSS